MDQAQTMLKCPFRNTLITKDYACENAREVTHRDGPGIVCSQADSHQRCLEIFEALKNVGLTALDMPDDLTQMPASAISKIQYGGLQGLSDLINQKVDTVDNINALLSNVVATYGSIAAIDFSETSQTIQNYSLRKRRK